MHSTHYDELNDIEQLKYNQDYIIAMKNNDLPSIKHLTQLGTPIAFDHGASCSNLYQMFSQQDELEINQKTDMLIYLFEHGIPHPNAEELEKNIIITYAFDNIYYNLMEYFIEHFDFSNFTQYRILANCIGSILNLQAHGTTKYYDQWINKQHPIILDDCEDLHYLWQQRKFKLFNQHILLHTHHLDKFIGSFGVFSKLKEGFLNMSDNECINRMAQCLLNLINQLPQDNWLSIISLLDSRIDEDSNNIEAKNIKSIITYNRYSNTIVGNNYTNQTKKKI